MRCTGLDQGQNCSQRSSRFNEGHEELMLWRYYQLAVDHHSEVSHRRARTTSAIRKVESGSSSSAKQFSGLRRLEKLKAEAEIRLATLKNNFVSAVLERPESLNSMCKENLKCTKVKPRHRNDRYLDLRTPLNIFDISQS